MKAHPSMVAGASEILLHGARKADETESARLRWRARNYRPEKPKNISPHTYMYLPRCQSGATSARPDEHATGLLSPRWARSIATLCQTLFCNSVPTPYGPLEFTVH